MNTLSRQGRQLIGAARERPTALDRDRIRAALALRIALIPVASPPSTTPPAHAGAAAAKIAGALGIGAKVATGLLVLGFSAGVLVGRATAPSITAPQSVAMTTTPLEAPIESNAKPMTPQLGAMNAPPNVLPSPNVAPTQSTSIATAIAEPARVNAKPVATSIASPSSDTRASSAASPAPSVDSANESGATNEPPAHARSIAEETAALREAHAALQSGDANAALAKLDDLGARFPHGALQEERTTAHVLALCAAGRVAEARAEAERFLAEVPGSVQAARVRASCAFATPR